MKDFRYLEADGIRTRYVDEGTGDPLILVHGGHFGGYGSARDWDRNFDDLAKTFRTIAFDKVGMGFSANPEHDEDYVIGATVRQLAGLMGALGLPRAHVVGHSRGGYTATRFALDHPGLVASLVIIDSSTLMTPPNPIYAEWDSQAAKISDLRDRARFLISVNSYGDSHVSDGLLEEMQAILSSPKTIAAKERLTALGDQFADDLVARQGETHARIRNGELKCPTLVVWGFNDPSATMERCGIPCMELILPAVAESEVLILNQAGHYSFRERPGAFNAAVRSFLERHHPHGL